MGAPEELDKEIEKLKHVPMIIVEGKKDINSLNEFGITNVVEIRGPIYLFCEDIAKKHKMVAILTDLDKEGKKLYSKLKKGLEKNGVKIDDVFRNFLFEETKITQIEGLSNLL